MSLFSNPFKLSSPRRRSSGTRLPYSSNGTTITTGWDPFEKPKLSGGKPGLYNIWMTQSQRSRWLKTGGILAFIILLYYFFIGNRDIGVKNIYTPSTSPTTKCTQPHDLSRPLVQYVLCIDAGSTGSRIHVYKFNNCGPTPELEHEEFKMTEPRPQGSGLSSYKSDAEGAARSLDPLMDVAMRTVPDEYKSCSPIIVKATAGLRLLGEETSSNILEAVRTRLETVYPFPVVSREKGGVEIMTGEDEGIFAWITTNYLLGRIGGPGDTSTAAVFDLGGGSTQIVFEPQFKAEAQMAEGAHKYELDFGGRHFQLYQHSHLGYGLMSARESLHRSVVDNMHMQHTDKNWLDFPILNPCIAPGMSREINLTFPDGHDLAPVQRVVMEGPSEPMATHCRALAEGILHKDATCSLIPCSFNGIHQPSLEQTFAREDVYILSFFYDRTHVLGMPDSFSLRELHDLTGKVCGGEKTWSAFANIKGALEDLRDRPEWCLDLSFINALLRTGYEMPIDREVKIGKKLRGYELGWCLGASLPLLEEGSGWTCSIKEVS